MKKRCSACKLELPLEMFGSNRSRRDGKNAQCISCARESCKTSRERRPGGVHYSTVIRHLKEVSSTVTPSLESAFSVVIAHLELIMIGEKAASISDRRRGRGVDGTLSPVQQVANKWKQKPEGRSCKKCGAYLETSVKRQRHKAGSSNHSWYWIWRCRKSCGGSEAITFEGHEIKLAKKLDQVYVKANGG